MNRKKPTLIFDGDCGFCRFWVNRLRFETGENIEFRTSEEAAPDFPGIPPGRFEHSVQLAIPDGPVLEGSKAVFEALALSGSPVMAWCYRKIPLFGAVSESVYAFVAAHRKFFSRLTFLFWGKDPQPCSFIFSRKIFFGFLSVIYFTAFASLLVQIEGLIGSQGILPLPPLLDAIEKNTGGGGFGRFPVLFWLSSSDAMLKGVCAAGMGLSLAILTGWLRPLVLFLAWYLYLSLHLAGQIFLGFQWDILLLETGFLSIFLASFQWRPSKEGETRVSAVPRFLLWFLLFKLMLSSGLVKLMSGDEAWKSLTALAFHFETQPLSTWTAWWMHQLPAAVLKGMTAGMFFVELVLPFFIWGPRRIRHLAGFGFIFLQITILLTGNYTFFNWLSIALTLLLFDDALWPHACKTGLVKKEIGRKGIWPRWIQVVLLVFIMVLNLAVVPARLGFTFPLQGLLQRAVAPFQPFRLANNYGLFAVMTTSRPEIVVEGTRDGVAWEEYEFRYKPGNPARRPGFVAPHQPRLDWQMWFAALSPVERNRWFGNFCFRLMQGAEPVLNLLEKNPFPDEPPLALRATLYDYHFTTKNERKETGSWWRRDNPRPYLPPVSIKR